MPARLSGNEWVQASACTTLETLPHTPQQGTPVPPPSHVQKLLREHLVVTLFLTMLVGAGGNAVSVRAAECAHGRARQPSCRTGQTVLFLPSRIVHTACHNAARCNFTCQHPRACTNPHAPASGAAAPPRPRCGVWVACACLRLRLLLLLVLLLLLLLLDAASMPWRAGASVDMLLRGGAPRAAQHEAEPPLLRLGGHAAHAWPPQVPSGLLACAHLQAGWKPLWNMGAPGSGPLNKL